MCRHQLAPIKGLPTPHAHATPSPSHAFLGGLGPAALPCPVSAQGIHFLGSILWCSGGLTSSEGSWQRGKAPSLWEAGPFRRQEPFPPQTDAARNKPAASRNSRRCEAPTPARKAGGSAAAGRAPPAPLSPQQKHKAMGKETGERGAGATVSVWSPTGQQEEARGAGKGKR